MLSQRADHTFATALAAMAALTVGFTLTVSTSNATAQQAASNEVVLSFDPIANVRFQAKIEATLVALQNKLGSKLCLAITDSKDAKVPSGNCGAPKATERAVVQIYLTRNGLMYRYYSTDGSAFDRATSMGSISKTIGVLALAETGAQTDESWCAKKFANVKNADGFSGYLDCGAAIARVTAVESIARSNNLSTINRLRKIDEKSLRAKLIKAGLANTPLDYHPGIAVATGVVEPTPRQILELFYAIGAGTATRTSFTQVTTQPPSRLAEWVAHVMSIPSQAIYVNTLMSAPVTHARGSARHLKPMLPADARIYAKTGTSSNSSTQVTGKFLVFSMASGGKVWTALVAVQSPRPSIQLGVGLQAGDFADIHRLLVNEIAGDGTQPRTLRTAFTTQSN